MSPLVIRSTSVLFVAAAIVYVAGYSGLVATEYRSQTASESSRYYPLPVLDKADYDTRLYALAHISTTTMAALQHSTSTQPLWPVRTVYPNPGAILPFQRIVAYYGNFYSTGMGILGEYSEQEVLNRLSSTTKLWEAADPHTPVLPAIHYIAVVAQGGPATGGKYILRMPDSQIDHALTMAAKLKGIVFLDVQVGFSTVETELPFLESYLKLPQVHLGIDPEFSMKGTAPPGREIGTLDAKDINFAIDYLAKLVRDNHLPPKVLVIHRFTQNMITNYQKIKSVPEVQLVINMDGWGSKEKKKGTYNRVVAPEPVQFTGVKLFYKNDLKPPSTGLLTTQEVMDLLPIPIYIQYQ